MNRLIRVGDGLSKPNSQPLQLDDVGRFLNGVHLVCEVTPVILHGFVCPDTLGPALA